MSDDQPKRETVIVRDPETGAEGFLCKLDMRECDHDFGDNSDVCLKCGTSIWAMAFMEYP